jgi:hypothetical protein
MATLKNPLAIGATIFFTIFASNAHCFPLSASQDLGLNPSLHLSDGGQYNASDAHGLVKRIVIDGLSLGGDPAKPTWAERQQTGNR